jgi:hypothetical protein
MAEGKKKNETAADLALNTPSDSGRGTGMTGAPSSTNPQAGGGAGGLTTSPHQVPENGGAPNAVAPNTKR